jgi:hypothetical protein
VQFSDEVGLLGRSPEPAEVPIALLVRVAQHVELPGAMKTRREPGIWEYTVLQY